MAMEPNWFDRKYDGKFNGAGAREVLETLAADSTLQLAVADAIGIHAEQEGKGVEGPTLTQRIREAIAVALEVPAEVA